MKMPLNMKKDVFDLKIISFRCFLATFFLVYLSILLLLFESFT